LRACKAIFRATYKGARTGIFPEKGKANLPRTDAKNLKEGNLLVLVLAFVVSGLTDAFRIGFLPYLPFIALDMIASNLLLAMDMMVVSPMTT
jgi:type III secretion protein R